MTLEKHYRALENMYLGAPINAIFRPRIEVFDKYAEIEIDVGERYFHAAGAVHGAVYFKMLDDAAFFAANSLVMDHFVLTKSFTTRLFRPISSGSMKSIGRVVDETDGGIAAEALVYDGDGHKLGKGNGIFVRGRMKLADVPGYQ